MNPSMFDKIRESVSKGVEEEATQPVPVAAAPVAPTAKFYNFFVKGSKTGSATELEGETTVADAFKKATGGSAPSGYRLMVSGKEVSTSGTLATLAKDIKLPEAANEITMEVVQRARGG